jgi:hypothetical protein
MLPSSLPMVFFLNCAAFVLFDVLDSVFIFLIVKCLTNAATVTQPPFSGSRRLAGDDVYSLCSIRRISAARSPMMTQGAIVLPVVTRGMMDPSAIRRFAIP